MQTVPTQEVQISAPVVLNSGGVKANVLRRLCVALFEPVDISFLVFFRIVYLAVQLFLPLRHYLYPGNVSWTEEGHNFAWHMKLRTKTGEAVFTVTHPDSGQTWTIKPEEHLKSHQVMKMSTKPELILQFGHYLAEEKRREGYDNVEVRARVMVSLNGRQPQLLIDPNVDLTKEEITLLPARWIVPLTTPLQSR